MCDSPCVKTERFAKTLFKISCIMEVDSLMPFLCTYTCINLVYSLVIVNKYELALVSSVFSASLFPSVFICSPGSAPSSCLVFIISPSVSWFPLTLPRPRCLNASLTGLLPVHLRTCSAFHVFPNANLPVPLSGFYSHHSLSLSGELFDLDAASLQLKVINYVSGWDHSYTHILYMQNM